MSNESPFEQEQLALVQRLESRWQLAGGAGGRGPAGLLRRVLLRLLAPLLAEQREFNAALVQLAYLERQNTTRLNAVMAQVVSAHDRISAVATQLGDASAYLTAATRDLGARVDTLGAYDGELNDRVARLSYAVGLLNDAVAAADEAAAGLAAEVGALKAGRGQAVRDA